MFKVISGDETRKGSLRVFVVGEQVVEDSEGGLQVQVDNIWNTKVKQQSSLEFNSFEKFQEENMDL